MLYTLKLNEIEIKNVITALKFTSENSVLGNEAESLQDYIMDEVEAQIDDKRRFHELLDSMRAKASKRGFMTDDEINAEIQAARAEARKV
jgi:cytochrome P450